jgi:hypothetical protein
MRFRTLRIAFSAISGIACILLCVLWARSYWRFDVINGQYSRSIVSVESIPGRILFSKCDSPTLVPTMVDLDSFPFDYSPQDDMLITERLGFGYSNWSRQDPGILIPHWFFIAIFATLSSLPWLRWRFTIRTLLIATTLVAVVLGLIVVWLR